MEDGRVRKRLAIIILAVLLIAAVAAALWLSQGEGEQWRVTVEVEGEGTAEPAEAVVEDGESVTIRLSPADGWTLYEVYLDGRLTDFAGTELVIPDIHGDREVRAVFAEVAPAASFTLTVFSNTGGSTEPSGTTVHPAGTVVRLTVAPDPGFHISDVRVDGESVGAVVETDIVMDADRSVEAVFAADAVAPTVHTVTASATSGGSISPSGTIPVEDGGSIAFSISARSGYRLSSLLVDGRSVGSGLSSYVLEDIRCDHEVRAVFSPSSGPSPEPAPSLTGIEVAVPPDRRDYTEGDLFDPAGMVVAARYSDGSARAVTDYAWMPAGPLSAADTEVTVSWHGRTCTVAISVSPWMTIAVYRLPDSRVVDTGERLDPSGLVATVTYHDGSSRSVGPDVLSLSPVEWEDEGVKTVSVIYAEDGHTASTSFEVYVASSEGFSAVVVSDDGVQKSVPLSGYEFDGPMAPGDARTLEIEVRNGTSMTVSPFLVLDRVSGGDDVCGAVSVSCNGSTFTVLDMRRGTSVGLDGIPSGGSATVSVTISMDPAAGNGLMRKSLTFTMGIFADGVPPAGGS